MRDGMLVTGGAGFIGSNFVRHVLQHTDLDVVVVDQLTYAGNLRNLDGLPRERLAFHHADIADRTAMEALLRTGPITSIVNFAAETHVDRSIDGPKAFVHSNLVGVFELLEAARATQADRPAFRFVHVSTDEVYGSLGPTGSFEEATPYAPNSPYAATKAGADHLVRAWHHTFKLPTLITNCSNNYGPYQFPEKLIPLMLLNALEGKPLPIYGDGLNVRDWLFVDDHCAGILAVLRGGTPGEKYNIGGNSERTNLQVVDALCAALEKHAPAAQNGALRAKGIAGYADLKTFVPDRPGHDRRYAIDASKIRRELGWQPSHRFEDAIEQTVAWYLAHRDWCDHVQSGNYRRERLGLGETAGAAT